MVVVVEGVVDPCVSSVGASLLYGLVATQLLKEGGHVRVNQQAGARPINILLQLTGLVCSGEAEV